jgi:hypothetical protein
MLGTPTAAAPLQTGARTDSAGGGTGIFRAIIGPSGRIAASRRIADSIRIADSGPIRSPSAISPGSSAKRTQPDDRRSISGHRSERK